MRMFVDTGAWVALNDRKDGHHLAASSFVQGLKVTPVLLFTTDYVIDETATLLRFKVSHTQAAAFLRMVSRSPNLIREQVSVDQLKRGEEIFTKYKDKKWSFTDCVSFAFMEDRGLVDAFAFDRNFAQFGMSLHPTQMV